MLVEHGPTQELYRLHDHWDYIIFDESSMIPLPYFVFATQAICRSCPKAEFLVAGDPKQIPPVIDISDKELESIGMQDETVYTMMRVTELNRAEEESRAQDQMERWLKSTCLCCRICRFMGCRS